ncbi:SDR family NAD(P)-dependent oxidoreductase [Chachezhania antarctica]|uniref:SDR family NAD(P)-dependent oxidoreductase n=1 Tax=Chachezhania antarctica TaxID=2340860 RepID=UPI001F0968F0|nr:SDR family oxidoreductase [Chachezhania antarctica]|tara:strand:- start:2032 stop:2796 length:765 start_codon:yes stop_codon:yes gene_type:complete
MFDLTGKVALLTGASKGMGLAMAQGLAENGATVVISSRKQDQLDEAAAGINKAVGRDAAVGIACNIGYPEQVEALVAKTRSQVGPVDILVGNAGVNPYYGSITDIPDDAYEKTMKSNVQSDLWLAKAVMGDMIEKGEGSMMFTSSIGAFKPSTSLGVYGMSKLALIGLIRNLAAELGPKGIRVNAICPGLIKTDFAKELWSNPAAKERAENDIPLRRLGEAEDLAGLAVFLGSAASRYITGQAITVDGGSVMWT